MGSKLGSGIQQALRELDYTQDIALDDNTPLNPRDFYHAFGPIQHGKTNKPVLDLTPYQYDTWELFLKQGRIMEIKGQKVGESTKWLIADFQLTTLPQDNPL